MSSRDLLLDLGYDDVVILDNYSYDSALIGVTQDNRAVYDYDRMVEWLVMEEGMTEEEACEWIDFNTLKAIPYMGPDAPIVMFPLQ